MKPLFKSIFLQYLPFLIVQKILLALQAYPPPLLSMELWVSQVPWSTPTAHLLSVSLADLLIAISTVIFTHFRVHNEEVNIVSN